MSKFDFIINPTTGRKVNINTRLGKTILQNYKNLNQIDDELLQEASAHLN